jgi:hypothetical protein
MRLRGCAGWSGANPLRWFCHDAAHLLCMWINPRRFTTTCHYSYDEPFKDTKFRSSYWKNLHVMYIRRHGKNILMIEYMAKLYLSLSSLISIYIQINAQLVK